MQVTLMVMLALGLVHGGSAGPPTPTQEPTPAVRRAS
jgi:hypothetical protein